MTITELIEKRTKAWDAAKVFVETKRDADGILSDADAKTYAEMEQKVKNFSAEIERMQAMDIYPQAESRCLCPCFHGKGRTGKLLRCTGKLYCRFFGEKNKAQRRRSSAVLHRAFP